MKTAEEILHSKAYGTTFTEAEATTAMREYANRKINEAIEIVKSDSSKELMIDLLIELKD